MEKPLVLSFGRKIDSKGDVEKVYQQMQILFDAGCRVLELVIDPLKAGWNTPIEDRHFRSGCSPIEAMESAYQEIANGKFDAVIIHGEDNLRSDIEYSQENRKKWMDIYNGLSIPEGYDRLAGIFIEKNNIDHEEFIALIEALYENNKHIAIRRGIYQEPDKKWFNQITSFFRGVDCANPYIDFHGAILFGNLKSAKMVKPEVQNIRLLGTGLGTASGDGVNFLNEIAEYKHLKIAFKTACEKSGINIVKEFKEKNALLELYTCYPVVPLAFLLSTGIGKSPAEIQKVLEDYPVTITGGMNFARAPWNNPALNGTIALMEIFNHSPEKYGIIHGNGGLGYKQGVAVFGKI